MEEQDLDLFERALAGNLSAEEQSAFDKQLSQDPALGRRFRIFQESRQALLVPSGEFRQAMAAAMDLVDQESRPARSLLSWQLAAAAVLLLLVVSAAVWFVIRPQTPDPQRLLASHFQAPASPFLVRGGDQPDSLLQQGAVAYEAGRYEEAIASWSLLQQDHPRSEEISLYLGICYLAISNPEKALASLSFETTQPALRSAAEWYRALARLSSGDVPGTVAALEAIVSQSGSYASRAESLLNALGKP